ncbi:hypothetical protein BKA82DRAFT_4107132 [Pisolithus tinctorius]|nr:hypothetical protein BKA82DRAFT_4107132 [Pisolithus tinctorius]
MATAHHTSHRASLLNGLRTGGVRSTSMSAPHTAAPGASFNIPRFASTSGQQSPFDEEDLDQVGELFTQQLHIHNNNGLSGAGPFTRALDGSNNGFVRQRLASQKGLNPNSVPFSPAYSQEVHQPVSSADAQLHAYQQMQLMQLEILRLQNAQMQRNHQVQAVVLAEALRQQAKRGVSGLSSAAPTISSFDIGPNPPARRPCQAELLKAQLGISGTSPQEKVPMTATAGGRYGSRPTASTIAFPSAPEVPESCSPPRQTFVHRAASYRSSPPLSDAADEENTPSKSDTATSWRRGSTTNSVLSGLRTTSTASLRVKVTPPPGERLSPPPAGGSLGKLRPRPLSFISTGARGVPTVTIDSEHEDTVSPASSASLSIPLTPSSSHDIAFLSPREEATKKLYEGLGVGRPAPSVVPSLPLALPQRLVSQPIRQPRGPPSGADELGPKNFASRIRRRAIGGLNVLMDARERRESIEAY